VSPHPTTRNLRASIYVDATEVIAAAGDRQLTVAEVARAVATSRRQLQRVFREIGGTSFREYVVAARLDYAKELLEQGVPVGLVARRTGYTHTSHFARAFRRHHGVKPSAYPRNGHG
jgi:AraC family transcriptional regulator of adaptative response / methylphosphotriester-DNA alkyltransferase methyltransferase